MIESAEKDVQKKLDYVYHKEKSGKSQFPYSEKTGYSIDAHLIGVIMTCSRKIFPFRLTMPQFGFYNLWHRNAHAFQPHRNRL